MNTRRGFLSSLLSACTALIVRPTMAVATVPRNIAWDYFGNVGAEKVLTGIFIVCHPVKSPVRISLSVSDPPRQIAEEIIDWQAPFPKNIFYISCPPTVCRNVLVTFESATPFTIYESHLTEAS
jgi:hypothetical protein